MSRVVIYLSVIVPFSLLLWSRPLSVSIYSYVGLAVCLFRGHSSTYCAAAISTRRMFANGVS